MRRLLNLHLKRKRAYGTTVLYIFFSRIFLCFQNYKNKKAYNKKIYHKINRTDEKLKRRGWWGRFFLGLFSHFSDEFFSEFSLNFRRKKAWKNVNYESFFMSLYFYTFFTVHANMKNVSAAFFISWNICICFLSFPLVNHPTSRKKRE